MQRLEDSRATGPWSTGHDHLSFGSCSSSLALHTDEAMSASSRMTQEVDEAGILGNVFDNPFASVLRSLKRVNNSCHLEDIQFEI